MNKIVAGPVKQQEDDDESLFGYTSSQVFSCSLPLWRIHEIKCMHLDSCTHGLFITWTQFRLLITFRQLLYTHIQIDDIDMAQSPFFTPLADFLSIPLSIPFYLLVIPPFVWCDPVHLGPRLLVNWPPLPQTLPSPSPFQIPNTPGQLCSILRRHRNSGFSGSRTFLLGQGDAKTAQVWVLGYFLTSNLQPPGSWDIFLLVVCNLKGPGIFSY